MQHEMEAKMKLEQQQKELAARQAEMQRRDEERQAYLAHVQIMKNQ